MATAFSIDSLFSQQAPERAAYDRITENMFTWHTDQPSVDESLMASCASYRAFERYLEGKDLFLLPRSRPELESILRRYSYDAIHNAISTSRSALQTGGYSRVCHIAEKSIRQVLNTGDNVSALLALHRNPTKTRSHDADPCATRSILTG